MAQFNRLVIPPPRGLNLARKEDSIELGESSVANNVDHFQSSIRKRNGYRNALAGNSDKAFYGGAPSQSIYLQPEEWWLDSPYAMTRARVQPGNAPPIGTEQDGRRDFFNQRPSLIVIPEGNTPGLRLNCRDTDPDWAIEVLIQPDDIPIFHSGGALADPLMKVIVAQKGYQTNGQWAIRLIPDATSTDRFYAVLTLYEGAVLGDGAGNPSTSATASQAIDFFYNSGTDRAWIEPGKRTWLAWKFAKGAPGVITSYYRIEGQTSSVSSSQNSDYAGAGTLRTNGVGSTAYPITIGRRPYQGAPRFGLAGAKIDEIAFLGTMPELRFWLESAIASTTTLQLPANWGTVTTAPPALTDWYVESEIPEEQLTTDAAVETDNLVQTSDLQLYYQFKPELVGYEPDGDALAGENHRIIRPRFTRGTATDNLAWLTGADATWVAASGVGGTFGLAMLPACSVSAQKYVYAEVMKSGNVAGYHGNRLFCGGIRVPNSTAYMSRATTGTTRTGYQWPDEFEIRHVFKIDALPVDTAYTETLSEICVARKGGAGVEDRYAANAVWRVNIAHNGANWIYRFTMARETGVQASIDSTTVAVEGSWVVVQAAVKFDSVPNRTMSLYVNGVREATSTTAVGRPWMSQASATDTTEPNKDDDDGRDANFPFVFGFSVETPTAVAPSPWNWRYGAWGIGGGGIGELGANRSYWAFHTNDTQKTPNDGIGYRGAFPLVGVFGGLQVLQKYSSESEAREWSTRGPTGEEMQRDGAKLLSNWDMEEGQGVMVFDKGYLKNHLRINPYSTALISSGACDRVNKPQLLGLWQQRQTSTSGEVVQNIYALTPGVLHQLNYDADGQRFLKPIGKCQTPEMWNNRSSSLRLPTAFQFSGALYVCTGLGAVKCIRNGKVTDAGLTPIFGNIGDDQTNLGWREFDRDGVLQPYALEYADGTATHPTNFSINKKYGWCITAYDPANGLESVPSRPIYLKVNEADGSGDGWTTVALRSMPHPPQRQASKIRLYRTTADGGVFKFFAELPSDYGANFSGFLDSNPDTKLQNVLDSWLNYPPPQNARIGMAFGSRALYFGVSDRPDTLFYSLQGQPGACPPQYQIQISSGQSTELTGGLILNDRVFVFTRTATYSVFDSGGDISIDSQALPPVQIALLRDDLGCISHHGIVTIEGFGAIIPTERGLYLFDGTQFVNLGGMEEDRIQPFWESLNLSVARNFTAAAHRRKKQYILYCSTSCSPGQFNDRALVFDWGRKAFTLQTQRDVLSTSTIVDEDTGQERVWCGSLNGNVFEFDPPDVELFSDGPVSAPFSGSIVTAKKDPLGSGKYTRLRLVSNSSLETEGDGLRGMNLYTTNAGTQWHTVPLKILWNDANWVLVDASAGTTDPTGFEWRLGAIGANWRHGLINYSTDVLNKRVLRVQYNLNPSPVTGSEFVMQCGYDESTPSSRFADATAQFAIHAGILGRGKRTLLQLHDITLYGGAPNNPWSISRVEVDWQVRGRSSYVAT